jgi:hypothetical protein
MVVFVYTTSDAGPAVAGDPDDVALDAGVQVAAAPSRFPILMALGA